MSDSKHFVICINNGEYAGTLDLRKVYEVLEDASAASRDYARIIDESGEDYLIGGLDKVPSLDGTEAARRERQR